MAKNRITLDFRENSMERLTKLKNRTDSGSYSDVVKQSLKLYEWIIKQTEAGNDLYMKSPEGELAHVPIFIEA